VWRTVLQRAPAGSVCAAARRAERRERRLRYHEGPRGRRADIEAHIQILYTGDVAKFSWVVPVDAVPDLGTGTDLLFSSLSSVTTPSFQTLYQLSGTCYQPPAPAYYGPTGTIGAAGTTGAAGSVGTIMAPSGVQVAFQGASVRSPPRSSSRRSERPSRRGSPTTATS